MLTLGVMDRAGLGKIACTNTRCAVIIPINTHNLVAAN